MDLTDLQKAACFQAMAQVVLADAILTDAEALYLDKLAERLGMSDEERAAQLRHINLGEPWAEALHHLPHSARRWLSQEAIAAASADGQFEIIEARAIERLRAWLDAHDEE
jgi:uncharacterized tellurite resistance protein B-like protein